MPKIRLKNFEHSGMIILFYNYNGVMDFFNQKKLTKS